MKDRSLSRKEVRFYGLLLVAGGVTLGFLVTLTMIRDFGASDIAYFIIMVIALAGCLWVVAKGMLLLRPRHPAAQMLSIPTLYAMSGGMLVVTLFFGAMANREGAWAYYLPMITLMLLFVIATCLRARKRQRRRA